METKYVKIAEKSLLKSFEYISKMFDDAWADNADVQAIMSGKDNNKKEEAWKPNLFEQAVCCMEGMDCWTDAYQNQSGREDIVRQINQLEMKLPRYQERFDELNAENVLAAELER